MWWRVSASASPRVWAKLTPCIGDWGTPRIACRRFDAEQLQQGGGDVDDVRVLVADARRRSAIPAGQRYDARVGDAAAVGLALPAAERCVTGPGPPPRVVGEGVLAAPVVVHLEVVLERLGGEVEEQALVAGAVLAALGAAPLSETTITIVLSELAQPSR